MERGVHTTCCPLQDRDEKHLISTRPKPRSAVSYVLSELQSVKNGVLPQLCACALVFRRADASRAFSGRWNVSQLRVTHKAAVVVLVRVVLQRGPHRVAAAFKSLLEGFGAHRIVLSLPPICPPRWGKFIGAFSATPWVPPRSKTHDLGVGSQALTGRPTRRFWAGPSGANCNGHKIQWQPESFTGANEMSTFGCRRAAIPRAPLVAVPHF